ncbi:MAG TPA: hypothetical protein PK878_02540 [bacterium]|nr:hypothetical protein [bacterium]HOL95963.1 hypothetical protein [bacterium]HPP00064.1 hypothetical protein [bacterium]HXK95402.1 hypothetical protein [bacterium]
MRMAKLFHKGTVVGWTVAGLLVWAHPAGAQAWWTAPQLKYVEIMEDIAHGSSPHYWTFGGPSTTDSTGDQTYLYTQDSGTNANFCQYVVAELRAAENADQVTHRWAAQHIGLPKGCSQFGRRVVIGNGGQAQEVQPFYAYPDDYTLGSRFEMILTADVPADCDPLHFNHDGTLLYTNHYLTSSGSRTDLHRYRVTGSLDEDGQAFTRDTAWQDQGTFHTSVGRLRNFAIRYINGKDLIFYGEGDTVNFPASLYVFDPETGTETQLLNEVFEPGEVTDSDIVNVKISGVGTGEMYVHVMGSIGGLKIYKLAADARSLENDGKPVVVFTPEDLNELTQSGAFSSHCRGFEVTDDGQYAFFSTHNAPNSIFVFHAQPGASVKDWMKQ